MTEVWYFSAAGHSREVAEGIARALDAPLLEICRQAKPVAETAVVVFPVYCQNIPEPVKPFLQGIDAKHIALIATYGRMDHGNVLWDAAELVNGQVIAGAYVPTGHTYLNEEISVDMDALQPVVDRILAPQPAEISKGKKWGLADLFPGFRSRIGVKLQKSEACTECGICSCRCPVQTMKNGKPGKNCIRCLRCVKVCPVHALVFSCTPVLRWYLRTPKQTQTVIYL